MPISVSEPSENAVLRSGSSAQLAGSAGRPRRFPIPGPGPGLPPRESPRLVEFSTDGGASWQRGTPAGSNGTWDKWTAAVPLTRPGAYVVIVRASYSGFPQFEDTAAAPLRLLAVGYPPSQLPHPLLYGVGQDGRVWGASWEAETWRGWTSIGDGIFSQGTPVTALSTGPGQVVLHAVGTDGRVWRTTFDVGGIWQTWKPVSAQTFAQGTELKSLEMDDGGRLFVYAIASDGVPSGAWFDGKAWREWLTIGSAGVFGGATSITALIR